MITIRMMSESDSDRMIFSVSGIKGSESQVFATMLANLFAGNSNVDFSYEGNCSDLEPSIEEQQAPVVPKKLETTSKPVIPEVPPVINDGSVTDSAVESILADDDVSVSAGAVEVSKPEEKENPADFVPDFVREAETELNEKAAVSSESPASTPTSTPTSTPEGNNHVALNISFDEKTKAKELLGKLIHWDREKKYWYCYEDKLDEVLEKTKNWKTDIIKY